MICINYVFIHTIILQYTLCIYNYIYNHMYIYIMYVYRHHINKYKHPFLWCFTPFRHVLYVGVDILGEAYAWNPMRPSMDG